jgi:hypothetical protein
MSALGQRSARQREQSKLRAKARTPERGIQMSAYVVQDQCINKIVTWLVGPRHDWELRIVQEALDQQGKIGDTFEEQLGNAMFELNCNAVDQRYGDNQAKEFRTLDYQFKREYADSSYAVYDLLGEWRYQCAEGDVPESSKLYQAIERVYDGLAHKFFRDLRGQKMDAVGKEQLRELADRITKLERAK